MSTHTTMAHRPYHQQRGASQGNAFTAHLHGRCGIDWVQATWGLARTRQAGPSISLAGTTPRPALALQQAHHGGAYTRATPQHVHRQPKPMPPANAPGKAQAKAPAQDLSERETTLATLLSFEPEIKPTLLQVTGWPLLETEATLQALISKGVVATRNVGQHRRYYTRGSAAQAIAEALP